MRTHIIIVFFIISLLGLSCNNKTEVMESKKEINQEVKEIEEEKNKNESMIDSLSKEIKNLSNTKNELNKREDFAEAEIYSLLKTSYLDHIIIGSRNLNRTKAFFENKLGFSIKEGSKHNNGISNFFVEFSDSSEIEFVSIKNPADKLAKEYSALLENDHFGFQFAIRTNEINKIKNHLLTLSSDFSQYDENKVYSTLSQKVINQELPLFFIKHNKNNFNTLTTHPNSTSGISAVWLSTNDIKKSARQFIDFGFSIVDKINVGNIQKKTVLMRNDNFEIILIDTDKYEISGLTISINNLDNIQNIIQNKLNLKIRKSQSIRGESIFLDPTTTNSIWFEFLEKAN